MIAAPAKTRLVLSPIYDGDVAIKGVVFDMDGTLTVPQNWMFGEMRTALGISNTVDILAHLSSLKGEEKDKASHDIKKVEDKARLEMKPRPGAENILNFLHEKSIKRTICTRNNLAPVLHLLTNHLSVVELDHPIVTRDFTPPKPSPEPLKHIAQNWEADPSSLIMVGDSADDMLSGHSAGFTTVLITSEANQHLKTSPLVDFVVDSLGDLVSLLEAGLELK